jgi:hypothetical protein
MNKSNFIISVLITPFFLGGCEFSVGAKKDLNTGLSASYNGLSADNIFLAGANDSALTNNEVVLGSKVKIIADGVDNFKVVDNKVFPGCTILLLSAANDSIIFIPDAYQDLTDGKAANEANYLTASLNTGDPMQVNGTYLLKVKFYDKQDTTHFIAAECSLKMFDGK